MKFRATIVVVICCLIALPVFAQNLIVGSQMDDESAWDIIYYNSNETPEYEFNFTGDSVDVASKRGGALRVLLEDGSLGGQLLLYQRVTCIAGMEYKASALIKVLDYYAPADVKGQWFQFYVAVDEPDPAASDFNPGGTKMFNMSSWDGDMNTQWEGFNGYWESVKTTSEIETAPYWVCPGEDGEEVEVTVGIKFGSSAIADAFYDLIVDDVAFYPLASANMVESSTMDDEGAWQVLYYNDDFLPEYEFGYEPQDVGSHIRGKCLRINTANSDAGQLLLYQRLPLEAGKTYRASAALHVADFITNLEETPPGPWYNFYLTDLEPDPAASDFNPGGTKILDISAWSEGCDVLFGWEAMRGYWEQIRCSAEIATSPYFTVPGEEGDIVDMTLGIKFGVRAPVPVDYTLYIDDVQLLYAEEVESGTSVETGAPIADQAGYVLQHNYPNPFNPSTKIAFTLPKTTHIQLDIVNIRGQVIETLFDQQLQAGQHSVTWNAAHYPNGIYYYQMRTNEYTATRKMVLLK